VDAAERRFLVTGAQGFLGRHVVQAILTSTPRAQVLGIGRSAYSQEFFSHSLHWASQPLRAPVPGYLREFTASARYRYRVLDLRDVAATAKLVREFSPDVVLHLASGLKGDPIDSLMRNGVESTVSLLEALGGLGRPGSRLIYASSGGVYGEVPERLLPIREDTTPRPADLYSISKLTSEQLCRVVGATYGTKVTCARVFNLVGPGQDERHVCGRFAAQAAAIILGRQPPLIETGDLRTSRDFIDVRDCATAMVLLATRAAAEETYNLASGREMSVAAVLRTVLEQSGLHEKVTVSCSSRLAPGVQRHYACIERLAGLGFRVERGIESTLADLLNYYVEDVAAAAGRLK